MKNSSFSPEKCPHLHPFHSTRQDNTRKFDKMRRKGEYCIMSTERRFTWTPHRRKCDAWRKKIRKGTIITLLFDSHANVVCFHWRSWTSCTRTRMQLEPNPRPLNVHGETVPKYMRNVSRCFFFHRHETCSKIRCKKKPKIERSAVRNDRIKFEHVVGTGHTCYGLTKKR